MRDTIRITPQQFEELPQKAKAILIAQDVISQVREGKLSATPGTFLNMKGECTLNDKITVEDIGGGCHVCAKGAVFIAAVRISGPREIAGISEGLPEVFSRITNFLMEVCFERAISPLFFWSKSDSSYQAYEFGRQHSDHKDRMVAIMLNIIRNGGEFDPTDRVTKGEIANALDLSPNVIAARPIVAIEAPKKAVKKTRKKLAHVH